MARFGYRSPCPRMGPEWAQGNLSNRCYISILGTEPALVGHVAVCGCGVLRLWCAAACG